MRSHESAAPDLSEMGTMLAIRTIKQLKLPRFVRRWNTGEPFASVIGCMEHLRYAVTYDKALLAAFDDAYLEAEAKGCGPEFRNALALEMEPIISSSYLVALSTMTSDWADAVLGECPSAGAATPFPNVDSCIRWILEHEEPPIFAGPMGETIVNAEGERIILTQALRAAMIDAHPGWLVRPT